MSADQPSVTPADVVDIIGRIHAHEILLAELFVSGFGRLTAEEAQAHMAKFTEAIVTVPRTAANTAAPETRPFLAATERWLLAFGEGMKQRIAAFYSESEAARKARNEDALRRARARDMN